MNAADGPRRTNVNAWLALLSAVVGFTCFWGIGGLVAVLLGMTALREIERSGGQQGGGIVSRLAIGLGVVNLGAVILGVGIAIALLVRPQASGTPTARPFPAPAATSPPVARGFRGPSAPSTPGEPLGSAAAGIRETLVGAVRLVDVHSASSLSAALQGQRRSADAHQEKLLLFVGAGNCHPCNGVGLALRDPRMQTALTGVRLVRVDAERFGPELLRLGIPVESVPGFALLAETLRPLDYVHGGEWDADIPENIAPVLGAFVRGKYARRRHAFTGVARPNDIAL